MTRYSLTLTLATLALSALSHPLSAHAEVESSDSGIYVRLQTGFQSGSLDADSKFSSALEADLGVGLLAEHFAIELSGGVSFSGQDYRRSEIIQVNSYLGARAEGRQQGGERGRGRRITRLPVGRARARIGLPAFDLPVSRDTGPLFKSLSFRS